MVWQGEYSKLFVGGTWVRPETDAVIDVLSPFTEEVIAQVPAASKADVDRAVAAARTAFDDGPWPRMPLAERMAAVRRLGEQLDARRGLAASIITDEMGCPITMSERMQAGLPPLAVAAHLELAEQYPFRTVRTSATGASLLVREPVGVVAAVVPWNVPLNIAIMKLVPALLTGCTVVLKPASETPLNAYLLADILSGIGLPDGVVSVLPCHRDESEYLVSHPSVDKVTFTGSTGVGRHIAAICGRDLRRLTTELGGKSAAIILDDADLAATVESLRYGSLRNNGQVCSLKTRLVVPKAAEAEFLDRLTAMIASMPIGDPRDRDTQMGPMVSARQRETVERYIAIGKDEGARLVTGGGRPAGFDRGYFVEPTVFAGVDAGMRIAQEEIFGPVLAVLPYETEDEAVAIANDSDYGLNGAVFTSDVEHAIDVARRIHTGTVEINGNPVGFASPIGGVKASGMGREAGLEGFDAYVEPKSIGLPKEYVAGLT